MPFNTASRQLPRKPQHIDLRVNPERQLERECAEPPTVCLPVGKVGVFSGRSLPSFAAAPSGLWRSERCLNIHCSLP